MDDVHRRHDLEERRQSVDAMMQILAMYIFEMPLWAAETLN